MITTDFIQVSGVNLEYRRLGPPPGNSPTLVFLHEGLGSVSLWRDFPDRLAELTGLGALVYSRAGYGKSDSVTLPRPVRFMHDEAEVLAKLLEQFSIGESIIVGHSDGASIALIFAGRQGTTGLRGLVLEAPHVVVEQFCLDSIAKIAEVYRTTDLRDKLSRHHGSNTDVAFRGWNDVWLNPGFRAWNIEEYLPSIAVPMLLVQGNDDEYGTLRQIELIERQVKGAVEVVTMENCGHSPHREQTELTLKAMEEFIRRLVASSRKNV